MRGFTSAAVSFAAIAALVTLIIALHFGYTAYKAARKSNQRTEQQTQAEVVQSSTTEDGKDGEALRPCGHDWIWFHNKCLYFSETEGTWTEAKDSCAALNSSLAVIDTKEELEFMLLIKGDRDHWIGLERRDLDLPWIWVDSTEFNNLFTVEDYSECAYLSYDSVRSLECYITRRWICTKMPIYEMK